MYNDDDHNSNNTASKREKMKRETYNPRQTSDEQFYWADHVQPGSSSNQPVWSP